MIQLGKEMNDYLKNVLEVIDSVKYSQQQKDEIKRDFIKLVKDIGEITSKRTIYKEIAEGLRKNMLSKLQKDSKLE